MILYPNIITILAKMIGYETQLYQVQPTQHWEE